MLIFCIYFSVLSDPQKRLVYDTFGVKGLDTKWDIMPRGKSSDEVMSMEGTAL